MHKNNNYKLIITLKTQIKNKMSEISSLCVAVHFKVTEAPFLFQWTFIVSRSWPFVGRTEGS